MSQCTWWPLYTCKRLVLQTVAAMEDAAYLAKSPAWVGYTLRVLQHPLFTSMLGCQSNKFAKQLFQAGAPLWALQQLSPDVANGLPPTLGMTFLRELAFPKRDGEGMSARAARLNPGVACACIDWLLCVDRVAVMVA